MVGDQLPLGPKCHLQVMPTQEVPASCNPFFLFVYLFVAVLGLDCCSGFSLAAASEDYCPIVVRWLLLLQSSTRASEAAEHGLSCGSRILGHRLRSGGA